MFSVPAIPHKIPECRIGNKQKLLNNKIIRIIPVKI